MRHLHRPVPTEITYKNMRFLIIDTPEDAHVDIFVEECRKYNVKDVVRVCEPRYDASKVEEHGLRVHDWPFEDGSPPPQDIQEKWFELLRVRFRDDPTACIAVHCLAGLGRAPALVCLALMELGMPFEDAVEFIRSRRDGALNKKQLTYLSKYRARKRLRQPKERTCHLL